MDSKQPEDSNEEVSCISDLCRADDSVTSNDGRNCLTCLSSFPSSSSASISFQTNHHPFIDRFFPSSPTVSCISCQHEQLFPRLKHFYFFRETDCYLNSNFGLISASIHRKETQTCISNTKTSFSCSLHLTSPDNLFCCWKDRLQSKINSIDDHLD